MLNQVVLVGRIVRDPELRETESENKVTNITIAVPRAYKNADGEYETDFINCTLWNNIAQTATEYCKKGDLVGIKGRLQTRTEETEDGKKTIMDVVAEKVTFLQASRDSHETSKDTGDRV